MPAWTQEDIPNADRLFYRVHKSFRKFGPNVFVERDGGVSTDWERYSTAQEAQGRAKVPADNGIVSLVAGTVRAIDGLSVIHTPWEGPPPPEPNRAHADVTGLGTTGPQVNARRHLLFAAATVEIPLP